MNCEILKMDYNGSLKMDYGLVKWIRDLAKNNFKVLRTRNFDTLLSVNFSNGRNFFPGFGTKKFFEYRTVSVGVCFPKFRSILPSFYISGIFTQHLLQ